MLSNKIGYFSKGALISELRDKLGAYNFEAVQSLIENGRYAEKVETTVCVHDGKEYTSFFARPDKSLSRKFYRSASPLSYVLKAARAHKEDVRFKFIFLYNILFEYTSHKDASKYILNIFLHLELFNITKTCTSIFESLLSENLELLVPKNNSLLLIAISDKSYCIANALLRYGYEAQNASIKQFESQFVNKDLDALISPIKNNSYNEEQCGYICGLLNEALLTEFLKKLNKINPNDMQRQTILCRIFDSAVTRYRDEKYVFYRRYGENIVINSDNKYMRKIKACLDNGMNVNHMYEANGGKYYDKCTALHRAAHSGLVDVVRILLAIDGVQLNTETSRKPSEYGDEYLEHSALSLVISNNNIHIEEQKEIFQLLLNKGANTDIAMERFYDQSYGTSDIPYNELMQEREKKEDQSAYCQPVCCTMF